MNPSEQELIDIADHMLAQLEADYIKTHQADFSIQPECPE